MGLPGECDGAGACVAVCTPTPDVTVDLPTSVLPAVLGPTYTDMTNGFTIDAVNCNTPMLCDITTTFRGIGSNAYGDAFAFDSSDSLLISFFDQDGNARSASTVMIVLHPQGAAGSVSVLFDGVGPVTYLTVPGQAIDLSGTSAHEIEVTNTAGSIFWQSLNYDHDCL